MGRRSGRGGRKGDRGSIFRALLVFSLIWLVVGFVSGTYLLRGPIGWMVDRGQAAGWSPDLERLVMILVIVLYVLGSAVVAFFLYRLQRGRRLWPRVGFAAVLAGAMVATLWTWMSPSSATPEGSFVPSVGGRFAFGPYPTDEIMDSLNAHGFEGVISLLHPAVVPFEPKLLAEEEARAREHGLVFVSAAMLPWVAENEAALEKIRQIGREGSGLYYVHCYLGRDRIRLARAALMEVAGDGRLAAESSATLFDSYPEGLERGPIHLLEGDVFVSPYPTPFEFGHIERRGVRSVVSLLDPENEADQRWIEEERELLDGSPIGFHLSPIRSRPFDPGQALETARLARTLPAPVVVHDFRGESTAVEAFIQAYVYDRPGIPPDILEDPLADGPVTVASFNLAAGPRPRGPEFRQLRLRGIRQIVFWGSGGEDSVDGDREVSEGAGVGWRAFSGDLDDLVDLVEDGGPWYVYGDRVLEVLSELTAQTPPPMPDVPRMPAAGGS